ncbi:MAG: hypothetical protein JNM69_38755 [Archangium sp.]|nr:hypothetical protein [Archangium sp.]
MRVLLLCLALVGCESGTAVVLDVTVPGSVGSSFSEGARGVLVTTTSLGTLGSVVLCGQALPSPLVLSQDLGFGCLGSRDGKSETVSAWVEPMPAGWSGAPCSTSRQFYDSLGLSGVDGGSPFAGTPQATWAQATQSATWKRDLSPCGGNLKAALTLAVP